MNDIDLMISFFEKLNIIYKIYHSPESIYRGRKVPGATTIELIDPDKQAHIHFYFDLEEDGGAIRSKNPTIF